LRWVGTSLAALSWIAGGTTGAGRGAGVASREGGQAGPLGALAAASAFDGAFGSEGDDASFGPFDVALSAAGQETVVGGTRDVLDLQTRRLADLSGLDGEHGFGAVSAEHGAGAVVFAPGSAPAAALGVETSEEQFRAATQDRRRVGALPSAAARLREDGRARSTAAPARRRGRGMGNGG
jgi:hypothetical protein